MTFLLIIPFMAFGCQEKDKTEMPVNSPGDERIKSDNILRLDTGFDGSLAFEHVKRQVDFGPRYSGSQAIKQTREYMKSQLESFGLKVEVDAFTAITPNPKFPKVEMANLIAEIPGEKPEVIVIGSHYDTKWFPDIHFVGANDGGSSTGVLLELARVLSKNRPKYTLWLTFFDGEEAMNGVWMGTDNTYGSRHMVDRLRKEGKIGSVKAMILLDMVGDKELGIVRDANSVNWMVNTIWANATKLGYKKHFLDLGMYIEDDHIPFLKAGVPAVDLIDFSFGSTASNCGPGGSGNCYWHTDQDTLDKISAESLKVVGDTVLASLPDIADQIR